MKSLNHHVDAVYVVANEWSKIRCACGAEFTGHGLLSAQIDAFAAHVVGQFAIDRPPADVIEDARRAFEQRQGR